jgi:hypothetical protein
MRKAIEVASDHFDRLRIRPELTKTPVVLTYLDVHELAETAG